MAIKVKIISLSLLILVSFLCIGLISACNSTENNINGYYQYEKTIYRNPLSSYLMVKENAPDYVITDDCFNILYNDGTEEQISTVFKKSKLNKNDFEDSIQPYIEILDTSGFKQCYQYIIDDVYRLYVMNDEVWLALCANDTMWSIYKLDKIEED